MENERRLIVSFKNQILILISILNEPHQSTAVLTQTRLKVLLESRNDLK